MKKKNPAKMTFHASIKWFILHNTLSYEKNIYMDKMSQEKFTFYYICSCCYYFMFQHFKNFIAI